MKVKVLFVCLGNICRSPLAEAVFRKLVTEAGLSQDVEIDSAGTGSWHAGELPDRRARQVADVHGCPTHHRARQVTSKDFETFDYVIGMDRSNIANLRAWAGAQPEKISLMMEWAADATTDEVPDPYYGEMADFEHVIALLEPACQGLFGSVKQLLHQRQQFQELRR